MYGKNGAYEASFVRPTLTDFTFNSTWSLSLLLSLPHPSDVCSPSFSRQCLPTYVYLPTYTYNTTLPSPYYPRNVQQQSFFLSSPIILQHTAKEEESSIPPPKVALREHIKKQSKKVLITI